MSEELIAISVFLIVIVSVVVVLSPGLVPSVVSVVTGATESCLTTPYDSKCNCAEGFRKIYVPWMSIPKWSCEELDALLLDPESPTFQEDAIVFVKAYLTEHCGDVCGDIYCGELCEEGHPYICEQDLYMKAGFGYDKHGRRLVLVECIRVLTRDEEGRAKSGTTPWTMSFLVESATDTPLAYKVQQNYCSDGIERCEPPVDILETTGVEIAWVTGAPVVLE